MEKARTSFWTEWKKESDTSNKGEHATARIGMAQVTSAVLHAGFPCKCHVADTAAEQLQTVSSLERLVLTDTC